MLRVWEKLNHWVRLTVLVIMNSFKPIMNTQLMRFKRRLGPKNDWDLMCAALAEIAGKKISSGNVIVVVDTRKPKRYIRNANSTQKVCFVNNLAFTAQKHCYLVS